MHDTKIYDTFLDRRRQHNADMLRDANAATRRKERDERGLEAISAGLNAIRNATGGVEHIDRWADAAWQLALSMLGS